MGLLEEYYRDLRADRALGGLLLCAVTIIGGLIVGLACWFALP